MAITPATYNLRVQKRADHPMAVTFKDSTGTAINLTGYTVLAQVWDKCRTSKIGDWTVAITSAAAGQVSLTLPHTVTAVLPAEAYYDVMLVAPNGVREYYVQGVIRASEGYTTPP